MAKTVIMKAALQVFLAAICALLFASTALPHGGGLDKNGGHHNRKTGQYHQHRSPATSPPSYSSGYSTPRSTTSRYLASSQSDRSVLIGKYFRAANGPEVLSWDGNKFKRDVSGSLRKRVLARDGHQCVICSSTYDLEVDHRRALMNGGDNRLANLATLCHECHVAKTKMDNGLRRKRERLYSR